MIIRLLFLSFFSLAVCSVFAQQRFFTKTGKIEFDATTATSLDKIAGVHKAVTCVLDIQTGQMQFSLLMKGFEFEQALMQEHFNENYVESHKFPKSEFKGIITAKTDIDYSKPGTYQVIVKGNLSLHGETKEVSANGTLVITGGSIQMSSQFFISLSDFKIKIPSLVSDKVSNKANIKVSGILNPLKN